MVIQIEKELNGRMSKEKEKDNGERYEGKFKDGVFEGKGIYYWNNGDRYDGNGKMDYIKEEEFFILIMVIDMKVNLNTIKKKEK